MLAADVAGQASEGEQDVGAERVELVVKGEIELLLLRILPLGRSAAADVDQAVVDSAACETQLRTHAAARHLNVATEAAQIGQRVDVRDAFGGSGGQGAQMVVDRAAPLEGSCGICGSTNSTRSAVWVTICSWVRSYIRIIHRSAMGKGSRRNGVG
jgi:hypothetical protein